MADANSSINLLVRKSNRTPWYNLMRSQKARIKQLGGSKKTVWFPFGPQDVDYSGFGLEYSTIARPGKKPLLEATAELNRSVRFTVVIADRNTKGLVPVEEILDDLRTIATEDSDCVFVYGSVALPYRVRLTSLSYRDMWRDKYGSIIQAEVEIQLDEKPIVEQNVVALRAITYEPAASSSSAGSGSSSPPEEPSGDPPDIVPDCGLDGSCGGVIFVPLTPT